ncbi:MAG: HAMP domain-containing histidine kinase [Clostridiaceae bacterium]|nr:HAMP domain-containing histidine kinase [Clostridiaceae bacterium]
MRANSSMRAKFLIFTVVFFSFFLTVRFVSCINYCGVQLELIFHNYSCLAKSFSESFMNYIETVWVMEELTGISIIDSSYDFSVIKEQIDSFREKGIENIYIYDGEGRNIYSFYVSRKNFTLKPFLDDVINGKDKIVTINYDDSGESNIWAVSAIKKEGDLKGIAAVCINANILGKYLQIIDNEAYGLDYHYSVMDNSGNVVYCSNNKVKPCNMLCFTDGTEINGNDLHKKEILRSFLSNNPKSISADFPVEGIDWSFRITLPSETIKPWFYWQIKNDLMMMSVFALFSLIAYLLLNKRIIEALSKFSEASIKVINGDYSARIRLDGYKELKEASDNFDRMLDTIERNQQTKTEYLMNIFHDIKNPLNVIFASMQLMENYKSINDPESFRSKVLTQVKLIRQNCYRLMRLTRNLIDINKHDNGFLKIKLCNYDMVKLIKGITDSVKKYTELKGINLIFTSELESQIMACDPDMIERIILNLISNAIKFTDRDGTITVSIRQLDNGNKLLLMVQDTGIGIPKNKLNTIFDRFKQAEDLFNRNKEGSGLGLSVVKAFVNAHQGDISVKSEYMKGTTFYITLPVITVDNAADCPPVKNSTSSNVLNSLNIEFSDIYSGFEEEVS